MVGLGDNDAKWVKVCLRHWWDEAEKIEKDLVMVIVQIPGNVHDVFGTMRREMCPISSLSIRSN